MDNLSQPVRQRHMTTCKLETHDNTAHVDCSVSMATSTDESYHPHTTYTLQVQQINIDTTGNVKMNNQKIQQIVISKHV